MEEAMKLTCFAMASLIFGFGGVQLLRAHRNFQQ
jgi:hypothetical protein